MMDKWPAFETYDLDMSDPDASAEMERRWKKYDRQMKALIARGGVHQDEDGWWIDDASGELIGPDPEIERPSTSRKIAQARPFAEMLPELAESIRRARGRPRVESPKQPVTIRLDADVLEKFRATGKGWQSRINDALRRAKV